MDDLIISECLAKHPGACSEVEAVDLEAQALYKEVQSEIGTMGAKNLTVKINRYRYLNELRSQLNKNRVEQVSEFVVRN